MKRSVNFERAKNMVENDKLNFDKEEFSKQLHKLLSDYFYFDGLTVNVMTGENSPTLLVVSVTGAKKMRSA